MKYSLTLLSLAIATNLYSADPPEYKWNEVEIDKVMAKPTLSWPIKIPSSGIRTPAGKSTSSPKI
jgi:hypothetical protein